MGIKISVGTEEVAAERDSEEPRRLSEVVEHVGEGQEGPSGWPRAGDARKRRREHAGALDWAW